MSAVVVMIVSVITAPIFPLLSVLWLRRCSCLVGCVGQLDDMINGAFAVSG
jgi:hypothetical protein